MQGEVSQLHSGITNKDLHAQNEFGSEAGSQARKRTNAELATPETTHPHRVPRALSNPRRQLLAHAKLHLDSITTMRAPSTKVAPPLSPSSQCAQQARDLTEPAAQRLKPSVEVSKGSNAKITRKQITF